MKSNHHHPHNTREKLLAIVARGKLWFRRRLPPGLRWPVGLVLIALGFVGILPILGFWMIPLGIAVAAMDIRPLWRRWQRRSIQAQSVAHSPGKEIGDDDHDTTP